jgi:hypothetical protein
MAFHLHRHKLFSSPVSFREGEENIGLLFREEP